jgi:uncharacterized protein YgiM (DUF1202 family)
MARIIEYDERDYGSGSRFGGGSVAAAVILLLLILYLSGYLPWFTGASTTIRTPVTTPIAPGIVRPPVTGGGVLVPSGVVGYVIADNLNMRSGPGNYSPATYILPRGTRVTLLGETYQEADGDLWVQVRIEANEGPQIGWVNRRYIS